MAGEIIRLGDKTSHGGTVVEGSLADICMGSPIAYQGHMTSCPKCNGTFPIIEGVVTTTFYGQGVAVAGMRTSCGAVLLAGQFTDIVEWATSSDERPSARPSAFVESSETSRSDIGTTTPHQGVDEDEVETEQFYQLLDEDGKSIAAYRYDIVVGNEVLAAANSYSSGKTLSIKGAQSTSLVTWLDRDGGSRA